MKKEVLTQPNLQNYMFKEINGEVVIKMQFVGFLCVNNYKKVDVKSSSHEMFILIHQSSTCL
jgi:hypothetical protein